MIKTVNVCTITTTETWFTKISINFCTKTNYFDTFTTWFMATWVFAINASEQFSYYSANILTKHQTVIISVLNT